MQHRNYECPKCHNRTYDVDQIQATGGLFTKLFNIQNKRFTTITCQKCTYTEFFKTKTSGISNVFDFFTN